MRRKRNDQISAAPRCFVYILGSRRGGACRTYVGWTLDLDRRLAQHNDGSGAKSTRGRDWVLLYAECYATRGEAMRREWHLKRAKKLRRALRELLIEPPLQATNQATIIATTASATEMEST